MKTTNPTNPTSPQLIEEAREKVIKLFDNGYTKPTFGDLEQFDTLITQAFHAGEAKGRNDAVDKIKTAWQTTTTDGFDRLAGHLFEAARQGDKEGGVDSCVSCKGKGCYICNYTGTV